MKIKKVIVFFIVLMCPVVLSAQSVGLVLSGGGAKGLSHIGVIKALEENNIPIDYVAGTSIGAIVGGLYAIGMSPDEMIYLFKSKEFLAWYKGENEEEFRTYLYRQDPTPAMITVSIYKERDKDNKEQFKFSLPTSVISPYPMDMAVNQLFASSSAACGGDFDNLMVPFFCMSADIKNKKPYMAQKGDLGSAVRASMTFPGYFKPIVIDSTLLFDGGFYNNFPWMEMKEKYNPDYLIGVKCVQGKPMDPSEYNPLEQLESMITKDTDYNIPEEEGVLISGLYDYNLMDFDKIDRLVDSGYVNAMKKIPEIKARVKREMTAKERSDMRLEFRKKCSELRYNEVEITGNLTDDDKKFIKNLITEGDTSLTFDQIKRGYYRVIASEYLNGVYPVTYMNEDSLFTFSLRANKRNKLGLSIGGNISSSSLTQGYVGMSFRYLCDYPFKTKLDLQIGQFYTGASAYFRQDFRFKQMFFYELDLNIHRFNYFTSNQGILMTSSLSSNIREGELYATLNLATTISKRSNLLLELGVTGGANLYNYFPESVFSKYDKLDRSYIRYFTTRLRMKQSTLDYPMFPTSGRDRRLVVRYINSLESHTAGTLSDKSLEVRNRERNTYQARFTMTDFYPVTDWLSLGYNIDLSFSTNLDFSDYTTSLLMTPAFQPMLHSTTILLENYRAPVFAGVALMPVFKIRDNLYFHLTAAYFQPYKTLVKEAAGFYSHSDPFPYGGVMGNIAFVWQSPVGPISLSCAYYDKSDVKWYPQFNIGFLIFKNRGLRN